jgi:DNA-binding NtrC family response regulator
MNMNVPDVIPFTRRSPVAVETGITILVVTSDMQYADRIAQPLQSAGYTVKRSPNTEAALHTLAAIPTDVCLLGPLPESESLVGFTSQVTHRGWATQVLQLIPDNQLSDGTYQQRGIEICPWPGPTSLLQTIVSTAAQKSRLCAENRRLKRQIANRSVRDMIGRSPAMQTLRQQVQWQAEQSGAVLLCGESGVGLETAAQAIHESSRRAHRPFIKIDCRVLSAEALDLELWGPVTPVGAPKPTTRLQIADGGTLFLDGIECVALPVQRRLLALIRQQRCEHPITGEPIRYDVRVIACTTVKLQAKVDAGLFRSDLFEAFRAGVVDVPTLRERAEDVPSLAEHFLQRIALKEGRPMRVLTLDALNLLREHHWPGNIREMENVITRACAMDWGSRLTVPMIEPWLAKGPHSEELAGTPGMTLAEMERKLIEATFERYEGNREFTAKALQIGIRTLSGKLREYGYPPRGGPGSNRIAHPSTVAAAPERPFTENESRAA